MFMRHEAVNIAIQRDGRVLVTEDFRQRFDIHSALQRAGGKGMPQGVKPAMRNTDPTEQQTETVLIRAHRLHLVLSDNKGGGGLFLLLPQKRQQLLRNRNNAKEGRRFRGFYKAAVFSVFFAVMTTIIYENLTFCKIDVRPLKREQFSDAQPSVKAKHDSEHLRAPVGKCR